VGESRTNHEVFLALCHRLGLSRPDDPESEEEVAAALLSAGNGDGVLEALEARGIVHPECGEAPVQFVDVFPQTGDGKVHLFPADLDREAPHGLYHYQPDPATEEFPLVLISPATNRTISSTLGQLDTGQVPLEIHPDDAGSRGIRDGSTVRVWNTFGEVRCHARINPRIRPGVVELPKGIWSHNTLSGTTANALCPDTLTDLGGGACFNDARVQVESLRT
jgi:predicted molibdopterin-dependent oxidoreductase YjgC